MWERWALTVPRLMNRRRPISGLLRPSTASRTTSSSVGVRLSQLVDGVPGIGHGLAGPVAGGEHAGGLGRRLGLGPEHGQRIEAVDVEGAQAVLDPLGQRPVVEVD